jgi:hypothetical protein
VPADGIKATNYQEREIRHVLALHVLRFTRSSFYTFSLYTFPLYEQRKDKQTRLAYLFSNVQRLPTMHQRFPDDLAGERAPWRFVCSARSRFRPNPEARLGGS